MEFGQTLGKVGMCLVRKEASRMSEIRISRQSSHTNKGNYLKDLAGDILQEG